MESTFGRGFKGGVLGALILTAIMLVMQGTGMGEPMFVRTYEATIGGGDSALVTWVVAALLFLLSGGIWGAIYGGLVRESTIGKGMAFGVLPTLWLWFVVAPFMLGAPLFFGFNGTQILLPLIFNVVIWGGFLGWYCQRSELPSPAVGR